MASSDLQKVRAMVRRASRGGFVLPFADARLRRWCTWIRREASGERLTAAEARELDLGIAADLVERDTPEVVPRLWHELEADAALPALQQRIERAGEVFHVPAGLLVAFVIPFAVRLHSRTERRWRVPLTHQLGRWPVHLAIGKRMLARRCVLDPHMYDGPMLSGIRPASVRRHLVNALDHCPAETAPSSTSSLPPLVEPIVVHALPDPYWNVVCSIGAVVIDPSDPLPFDEAEPSVPADLHYSCELAFPLRVEALIARSVSMEVKCQGLRRWHDGLRLADAALRRYRLGQQQWLGDSARHMRDVDALLQLRDKLGAPRPDGG